MSGNPVHRVWSNPLYRRRIPLSVQWRPKTSSLYVVCWNAKCFPSSDASSISRCQIPARAAFWALPNPTGTTWVKDKRQGQSDQWRPIRISVIGQVCSCLICRYNVMKQNTNYGLTDTLSLSYVNSSLT